MLRYAKVFVKIIPKIKIFDAKNKKTPKKPKKGIFFSKKNLMVYTISEMSVRLRTKKCTLLGQKSVTKTNPKLFSLYNFVREVVIMVVLKM
jgi:hypothetical protein